MSAEGMTAGDRLDCTAVAARPLAEDDDVVISAATALWDAALEPAMAGLDREEYLARMTAGAVRALFLADARHVDDLHGQELHLPAIRAQEWDGSDLATAGLAQVRKDCAAFLRQAWPWLQADRTGPEKAGESFQLARCHHAGFPVGLYGLYTASLRTVAATFEPLSVLVAGSPEAGFMVTRIIASLEG